MNPSHDSSHGCRIMRGEQRTRPRRAASGDHFARYRPPSGLDYLERADRQKHFELVDRTIVDRDTSGGPVDIAAVEDRLVSAMDSDPVALGHRVAMEARHFALRDQLLVALAVDAVGVIELQEVAPAPVKPLGDDGVYALGRAAVA